MKNFWLTVCILLVLGVLGGGIYLYLNAGGIIKEVVEKVASKATNTKVTIDKVDVTIHKGEILMMGLRVRNAPPFQNGMAMRVNTIELKIKPDTLTDDVIIIEEIRVSGINTTYEHNEKLVNFDLIRSKIDSFRNNSIRQGDKINFNNYYNSLRFIIRNLTLQGGQVSIKSDKLFSRKTLVPFPNSNWKDFPRNKERATLDTMIGEILGVISDYINDVGQSSLKSALDGFKQNSKSIDINNPVDIVK